MNRGVKIRAWFKEHVMFTAILPYGFQEITTNSGLGRMVFNREFWSEWVFEEFFLPDIQMMHIRLADHLNEITSVLL
jgi:hypothetical protein